MCERLDRPVMAADVKFVGIQLTWDLVDKLRGDLAQSHEGGSRQKEFITRVRKWARGRNLEVCFAASEGAGSHGTLYAGHRRTTVKDRKKEIGKGLLGKMLADLGIDRDDF